MIRKIIKALWIFLVVIILAIVIVFVSISKGWIGYMPPVEELENPSYKFATEIFLKMRKCLVHGLTARKTGCTRLTRICHPVLSMLLLQRKMFVLSSIRVLMPKRCSVRL